MGARLSAEERWVRVPQYACARPCWRGDWTLAQFSLAVYLAGRVNYITGKARLSLATIRDETNWPWSLEKLRLDLHSLSEMGVIERLRCVLRQAIGDDAELLVPTRRRRLNLNEVDRVLVEVGRPDLWHTDLADVYEAAA